MYAVYLYCVYRSAVFRVYVCPCVRCIVMGGVEYWYCVSTGDLVPVN